MKTRKAVKLLSQHDIVPNHYRHVSRGHYRALQASETMGFHVSRLLQLQTKLMISEPTHMNMSATSTQYELNDTLYSTALIQMKSTLHFTKATAALFLHLKGDMTFVFKLIPSSLLKTIHHLHDDDQRPWSPSLGASDRLHAKSTT